MARGSVYLFDEYRQDTSDGTFDLDAAGVFEISLISNTGDLTATATPNISDFTEVTGGSYAAKTGLTLGWSSAGVLSLSGDQTWAQDASGPTDIRKALIHLTTGGAALGYVDLTDDGSTPVSTQDGPITISAGNIYTTTIA